MIGRDTQTIPAGKRRSWRRMSETTTDVLMPGAAAEAEAPESAAEARPTAAGALHVAEATNSTEYNGAASRSPHADVLQSWEWGELKRRTGWKPIRILIKD